MATITTQVELRMDRKLLTHAITRDRVCKICNECKPAEQYHLYRNKKGSYYRYGRCNECSKKKINAWNKANPDRLRAKKTRWKKNNPDKANAYWHVRRARQLNAPTNDFTLEQWREIKKEQQDLCFYCNNEAKLTQDHKVPLVRGGSHTKDNIVGACALCNCRKGTKTLEEFLNA